MASATAATPVVAKADGSSSSARKSGPPQTARLVELSKNAPSPVQAHAGMHFFAGAVGGAVAATILSPLDILRTRLQSSQTSGTHIKSHRLLIDIVKKENFFALWRGLMPTIFGVGPSRAIYFGSYNVCKRYLGDTHQQGLGLKGTSLHLTGATLAGLLTNTFMSPWWVIRLRLQLQHTPVEPFWKKFFSPSKAPVPVALATSSLGGPTIVSAATVSAEAAATGASGINRPYKGVWDTAVRIYREEGWKTFYRGLTASYLGVAETALQFAIYGYMKDWLRRAQQKETDLQAHRLHPPSSVLTLLPTQSWAFGISAFSKLLASALTYPHEVIRTRMREQKGKDVSQLKYRGILQCAKLILKEEGARGLYGGLGVHLLRTVPNAAILLFVVESMVGGEV
jgi:solute carrier family 25, member 33/36